VHTLLDLGIALHVPSSTNSEAAPRETHHVRDLEEQRVEAGQHTREQPPGVVPIIH